MLLTMFSFVLVLVTMPFSLCVTVKVCIFNALLFIFTKNQKSILSFSECWWISLLRNYIGGTRIRKGGSVSIRSFEIWRSKRTWFIFCHAMCWFVQKGGPQNCFIWCTTTRGKNQKWIFCISIIHKQRHRLLY